MSSFGSPINVSCYDSKAYERPFLERSADAGAICWRFHEFRLTADSAATAAGADAVCAFVNDRLDEQCLKTLFRNGVRLVALRCAGFNNVDLAAARALGVAVTRVPAYSPHAVAEHAVALLLTLNRKIHRAYNRVRDLNFSLQGLVGFDVFGKTVGIVGGGQIGKVAAQIFRGFQATVLVYDPFQDSDWATRHEVIYCSLESLLSRSDIVSLHLPLTPESHYLIDASAVAGMKRGAILINTSRGKLVESRAIIDGLKSGHLGGVALDVYEEEEGLFFEDHSGEVLQDDELSRLLTFPNVLITSHQAFLTQEALAQIAHVTTDNLLRFSGKQPFLDGSALVS